MQDNGEYVFKAFLVNASEYDNGNKETSGVWVDFPADEKQIKAALSEIGLPKNAKQGRYFIDDYVSNIDSIKPLLHSNLSIRELQETAELLNGLPPYEILKLNAVMETGVKCRNLAQVREFTRNVDYYTLVPEAHTHTELGTYLIYESGIFTGVPEMYKDAMDPERFGRYISRMEQGVFTTKGYLSKSGDEWQHGELKNYTPKCLIGCIAETAIETTKQLANDLDTLYREYSPEYAALADNPARAKKAIANLLRANKTNEVRSQLYNMARDCHIDRGTIIPLSNRITTFEESRCIKFCSIKEQLKQIEKNKSPVKPKGREDCL